MLYTRLIWEKKFEWFQADDVTKKYQEFERLADKKLPSLQLHLYKYLVCLACSILTFLALTALFTHFVYEKMGKLQMDIKINEILDFIVTTMDTMLPSKGRCTYSLGSSSGKNDINESICVINGIQLYHFSIYVLALYHLLGCLLLFFHVISAPFIFCNQKARGYDSLNEKGLTRDKNCCWAST